MRLAIVAMALLALVLWLMVAMNIIANLDSGGESSAARADSSATDGRAGLESDGAAGAPVAGPGADGRWQIMAVGDSITQTYQGGYSWRYFLDAHLRASDVDFDMVGPQQGPFALANVRPGFNMPVSGYAQPAGWDVDHAARGGRSLKFYANASLGRDAMSEDAPPSGQNAETDFANHRPDVAIVMLGTNDLLLGSEDELAQRGYSERDAAADLARIAEIAADANPSVGVLFVAPPPTLGEYSPNGRERAAVLRQLIRSTVTDLAEAGSAVAFVDGAVGFEPEEHHIDHTHPNATGDWIIARNIAGALAEDFGLGGTAFGVARATTPANPGVVPG